MSHSSEDSLEVKQTTKAAISDFQTWEKTKKFVVYKVIVNCDGRSWFIFRRYNEFHALYEK
ncbi:unnamed protein product, partial [Candidula unifasciata]